MEGPGEAGHMVDVVERGEQRTAAFSQLSQHSSVLDCLGFA